MTKQQDRFYWQLWDKVRRMHKGKSAKELAEIRHGLHVKALGKTKSHVMFSNKDFDLVIGVFKAEYDSGNLASQLLQMDQWKRRLRWVINHKFDVPEAYRNQIMMDQFKTIDLEELSEDQLKHLIYTLSNRFKHLEATRMEQVEATAPEECAVECPF